MLRQTLTIAAFAATLTIGGGALLAQHQGHGQQHHDHGAMHQALQQAIAATTRTPANVARDRYRHPLETLSFFGVAPNNTVVEIWPGGGWYTEILAPYVARGGGRYYAAAMNDNMFNGVRRLMTANPQLYGHINLATFPAFDANATRVPDGSADVVLTFRNVHNWRMGYQRERQDYSQEAFNQMFRMLRPGGTLGIVDHRLPESADAARETSSGYVKVSTVRRMAEAAGFRFVGSSEVNANPRDTADYPDGVWTLPPNLRRGEVERDRYVAIGESDRMTLRFVKPE
jgi:predicted methyltransferase